MKFKSDFLREINSRGFIYQSSDIDNLDDLMSKKKITAYIGFDITSDSLHVGSLVQLMLLHWLDFYDHKPIALMGGGTTLIGDPSGKDESRRILEFKDIEKNIENISNTFGRFINLNKLNKKVKYLIFSGIGTPSNFKSLLLKNNIKIFRFLEFPDHYNFDSTQILQIKKYAKENNLKILTTEKDYLRLEKYNRKGIKFLKMESVIQNKKRFVIKSYAEKFTNN